MCLESLRGTSDKATHLTPMADYRHRWGPDEPPVGAVAPRVLPGNEETQ